jgi:alkyldihydroxyacetonephosphate synthase
MGSSGSAELAEPPAMRWWGWGDDAHAAQLPPGALRQLPTRPRPALRASPPVALANVRLGSPSLSQGTLEALRGIVGEDGVRDDREERVLHAAGRSYPDLVRLRSGELEGAPDAVALPSSHAQVRAVLDLCAQRSIAVVPFGGGTSVVGGVAPLRGPHESVLALDMRRMARLLELDATSLTVTVEGGIRAAALERQLGARGLTLGHFPQSFEYVSLGGCVATRSAGQASSGYGSIEKMVLGLRLAAPAGDIELPAVPATAAGPGLRGLLVGSEGTLGVIDRLALRVRPLPQERIYEGVFFSDFGAGVQTLRALAQQHAMPDVARLSDEPETRSTLAMSGAGAIRDALGRVYLRARGYGRGCLAILGFEGAGEELAGRHRRARALVRRGGGLPVGRSPGEAWLRSRFAAPYLRDQLLTYGIMVETVETATRWSKLLSLHQGVGRAIEQALSACGTPGLVMCHVSHLYETGASLYFTFLAPRRAPDELGQWRAVKQAAGRAIVDGGGTITHHHAVGRDHMPWMPEEIGLTGLSALHAVKHELDPHGIMNPGKLLA